MEMMHRLFARWDHSFDKRWDTGAYGDALGIAFTIAAVLVLIGLVVRTVIRRRRARIAKALSLGLLPAPDVCTDLLEKYRKAKDTLLPLGIESALPTKINAGISPPSKETVKHVFQEGDEMLGMGDPALPFLISDKT